MRPVGVKHVRGRFWSKAAVIVQSQVVCPSLPVSGFFPPDIRVQSLFLVSAGQTSVHVIESEDSNIK